MNAKTVEIRDAGTFIPALAIRLDPACQADRYLLGRAGFGTTPMDQARYVMLARLAGGGGEAQTDPYEWRGGARTMRVAHGWLIDHFDEIESGAIVDVEYLLGESPEPKLSESAS